MTENSFLLLAEEERNAKLSKALGFYAQGYGDYGKIARAAITENEK
jgi:hypothetical protein